jgi:hypothetical protein
LVAFVVSAGLAREVDLVLGVETAAESLALVGSEVEVVVRGLAIPRHHVKYRGLAPTEATTVIDCPREQHLHSKSLDAIHSFVGELPLILETTRCVGCLE